MEIWKPIPGYVGLYEVSNFGNVKSFCAGKWHNKTMIRKLVPDKDGYMTVLLKKQGSYRNFKVHRLVAQAFIPNPNNYPMVNHIDEIKSNNLVSNLEWCTAKYNMCYNNKHQRVCKKVAMMDSKNRVIKVFDSVNSAANSVGVTASHLSTVLSKRRARNKLAGGYRWKFIKEG